MSEVFYGITLTPAAEGKRYQNPRFFTAPIPDVSRVHIEGYWPEIAAAYLAAGVDVVVNGVAQPAPVNEAEAFGAAAQAYAETQAEAKPAHRRRAKGDADE